MIRYDYFPWLTKNLLKQIFEKQKMYMLYTNVSVCWVFVTANELAMYEFIYVLCILNLINFIFSHEKMQLVKRLII